MLCCATMPAWLLQRQPEAGRGRPGHSRSGQGNITSHVQTAVWPPTFALWRCRLKDGQLRSLSVPMDGVVAPRRPYSCGTLVSPASATVGEVFTCMAFEQPLRERPFGARLLFVGTGSGECVTCSLS